MLEHESTYLEDFDAERAWLREPDLFPRFRIPDLGDPLADGKLDPDETLLVIEREGHRRAFRVKEMAYHHVAQGELAGQPYLLAFCVICHSGMGLDPRLEEEVHHFSAGGLYNGVVLLIDDETRTYWDQIRGLAMHGPLRGARMEAFPLEVTTVGAALREEADLTLSRSRPKGFARLFGRMSRNPFRRRGFFPPGFRRTMGPKDERLPELAHGLGVMTDGAQRFYPLDRVVGDVEDELGGRPLRVSIDPETHVPSAIWLDTGTRTMQIFSRWYGFVAAYPKTDVYQALDERPRAVAVRRAL
ncbi:MAG: DUF3179 domain-containing (seleno)protein [Thermoplasmata archaeon]